MLMPNKSMKKYWDKVYKLHYILDTKTKANLAAKNMKKGGYLVRISKVSRGYAIWIR